MTGSAISMSNSETNFSDTVLQNQMQTAKLSDDGSWIEIGPTQFAYDGWAQVGLVHPDLGRMREYRLQRIVRGLNQRDLAAILLFDPVSIRYACDITQNQLWNGHDTFRACLVCADGHMVLWEQRGRKSASRINSLVNEIRSGSCFSFKSTGARCEEGAAKFAGQIEEILQHHAGCNRRLAVDNIPIAGFVALEDKLIDISNGEELMHRARAIKGEDEILAMRCALFACEQSVAAMRELFGNGLCEDDLWAELHRQNLKRGGEGILARTLVSGPRTNPWYQECAPRYFSAGELLAFDTNMIGCFGMYANISRTWFVGDGEPTSRQLDLHKIAHDHISENAQLVRPGATFRELGRTGHVLPAAYDSQRCNTLFDGIGLGGEWPAIKVDQDWEQYGYDGVLQPGMVLCVGAYVGEDGGPDGVKLADQLLVTETGFENLTKCPFDPKLMG
ncbi:MAG: aminopeptidase P family protein [Rhizobiaceae bacterium]|nr:aminopeptidase P family protein [Rhizobiaceae bacterium]